MPHPLPFFIIFRFTRISPVGFPCQIWIRSGRPKSGLIWGYLPSLLTPNRTYKVKFLYQFLNDGGLQCQVTQIIFKGDARKINLFVQLAQMNKILTLDILAKCKCNRLPTTTSILYHFDLELVEHLFCTCPFATQIWNYFGHLPPPIFTKKSQIFWRSQIIPLDKKI